MTWSIVLLVPVVLALDGVQLNDDVIGYLGVPYAQPPVGALRFQNAIPVSLADQKFDSKQAVCLEWPYAEGSEDCLYMNIYKDSGAESKLPALVYVTNQMLSDDKIAAIVSNGLSLVVVSARTGLLGSLDGQDYGTSDVQAAVEFLKRNEEVFGVGDVTIWCEEEAAEICDAALASLEGKVTRAILVNGNQMTRTIGRDKFSTIAARKMFGALGDLDHLRQVPLGELLAAAAHVQTLFFPFGSPFRIRMDKEIPKSHVPTIYGVHRTASRGYATDANFTSDFTDETFEQFLASLIPDSLYRNGPLIRRLVSHEYIRSKLPLINPYSIYEQLNKILLDRDFFAPTWSLAQYLKKNTNVWVLEYGIDTPPKNCLQDGGWDDIQPFCDRLLAYYSRFARLGRPAEDSCNQKNPSWPAIGASKRDYFIRLMADGVPDWNFDFHTASLEFWAKLLPQLEKLTVDGTGTLETKKTDLWQILDFQEPDNEQLRTEL